jgi:protein-S-isoprenylcysteine O-methyltransferase Ste14
MSVLPAPKPSASASSVWYLLKRIILATLATAGVLLDRVTPLRGLVIGLIGVNVLATTLFRDRITLPFVLGFFAVMFVLRYGMLFGSFGRHGLAPRLIRRYGEDRGYAVYEALTAFSFFYRGTSFNLLVEYTTQSLPIPATWLVWTTGLAWAMMIGATVVNIWATLIIGIDVYYYKDMFVRRAIGTFEVSGPFRYFSNPMYGIGQFNAYGAALAYGSLWGLLATALNQGMMYLFYYAFEKPHIQRLFGKTDAPTEAVSVQH